MPEPSDEVRLARLRRKRVVLRAFNGAGLGLALGAILGALLGGLINAINPIKVNDVPIAWHESGMFGAVVGEFPGAFGGVGIGMTAAIPDRRRGMIAGTSIGVFTALLFMVGLFGNVALVSKPGGWVILGCGVIGGWTLSKLMRLIRARWKWWTRWDDGSG